MERKAGEEEEEVKSPQAKEEVLRGKQPCQYLDLGYLASRTVDNKPALYGIPRQSVSPRPLRECESLSL